MWGLGSEITICWAPQRNTMLTGTTNRVGTPVTVNGLSAIYHDGMWMPGPGPEQVRFEPDGMAHWGRDLVHTITLKTSDGVYGLHAPRTVVPHVDVPGARHVLGPRTRTGLMALSFAAIFTAAVFLASGLGKFVERVIVLTEPPPVRCRRDHRQGLRQPGRRPGAPHRPRRYSGSAAGSGPLSTGRPDPWAGVVLSTRRSRRR